MPPWEKYKAKPWEKRVQTGDRNAANDFLEKGFQFTPEQSEVVTNNLTQQDMEMQTYIQWLNLSNGTNHTPEMAQANLKYEYGDDATPQVANQMNKKALKWGRTKTAGAAIVETGESLLDAGAFMTEAYLKQSGIAQRMPREQYQVFENKDTGEIFEARAGVPAPFTAEEFEDWELVETIRGEEVWEELESVNFLEELSKETGELMPESWEEAQAYMRQKASAPFSGGAMDRTLQFLDKGGIMLTDNLPNLLASRVNPALGMTVMFSNERNAAYDGMVEAGINPEIAEQFATSYGALSAPVEYAENLGRISSAFGVNPKRTVLRAIKAKGGEALKNVGEEMIQKLLEDLAFNEAAKLSNEQHGTNVELRKIADIEGYVETGVSSLAMTTVMEALGLSVKGAKRGAKTAMTLGDANRMRKQMSNEEIDSTVESGEFTPEMGDAVKTPTEQNVEVANQSVFEPEVAEPIQDVDAPKVQEIRDPEGLIEGGEVISEKIPEDLFHGGASVDGKPIESLTRSFSGTQSGDNFGSGIYLSYNFDGAKTYASVVDDGYIYKTKVKDGLNILNPSNPVSKDLYVNVMYDLFNGKWSKAELEKHYESRPLTGSELAFEVSRIKGEDVNVNEFLSDYGVDGWHIPDDNAVVVFDDNNVNITSSKKFNRDLKESDLKLKPQQEEIGAEETRITVEADNLLREGYGIDPTKDPETRTHLSLIEESIRADRDVNILLDELKSNPRPTTDLEAADIAREKERIARDLKDKTAELSSAYQSGDDQKIADIATELGSLKRRLIDFTNISRLAKTETGRALSAYNLTLNKEKDLTDHVADATAEKGEKLTEEELDNIEGAYNERKEVEDKIKEIKGEPKDIDEKLAEIRQNIDEKKRTIKKDKKKSKTAKQKELEALKEIQRDQDKMFELIIQLDEQTAKLNDPKIKNDPEGYKATIEILLDLRSKSQWWKDLKKSNSRADERRVKLLQDTFDNLEAQYKGKFRDTKTKKEDVTDSEIVDLKNKINYIREVMRLEDKIAEIDEDIRLIGEGRYDEITPTKRVERENERDEKLESLYNELANKRKRLQTLKTDIGTGKGIKFLEFQRAMKLSLDSWLLRQGGPSLKSNPFLTLDAWFKSFQGYREESFYEMQRMMESTESYKNSKDKMGVVYNDIDAGFEEHQEAINSALAEKIPPVAGSNRHMVLGVNLLRWNLSKRILNRHPNKSAEFYQAAGKWINDLTGRGGLGKMESSARGLTAFFTAPRYTTSKWSNIANMRRAWIKKDGKKEFNKELAKEIAGQKARMYGGYAMMATALIAMGFEMGTDPEDPLFMKFRKGDVVVDIAPHMTAEMRLAALSMEAFAANSLGIGELEGEYDADTFNKMLRYAGYKVVPTVGTIFELIEGETIVGEERNIIETLALYPLPIMVEGMYQDLFKDQEDMSDILTSQAFQFIGAGGGIYEDTEQEFKRIGD